MYEFRLDFYLKKLLHCPISSKNYLNQKQWAGPSYSCKGLSTVSKNVHRFLKMAQPICCKSNHMVHIPFLGKKKFEVPGLLEILFSHGGSAWLSFWINFLSFPILKSERSCICQNSKKQFFFFPNDFQSNMCRSVLIF